MTQEEITNIFLMLIIAYFLSLKVKEVLNL